jgi:ubiquinol oxidase
MYLIIHTIQAENERMHLLVCLQMFNASFFTRTLVITAQMTMTPVLMVLYTFNPSAMHRFVGYLEETACHTYASIVKQVETPGTELHEAWFHLPAPEIAVSYWRLPHDATFGDTLRCMFADETHHRDVNHTFAEMDLSDPSPFALQHKKNAIRAFEMHSTGERAWAEKYTLDTPTDDLPKSNVEMVVA